MNTFTSSNQVRKVHVREEDRRLADGRPFKLRIVAALVESVPLAEALIGYVPEGTMLPNVRTQGVLDRESPPKEYLDEYNNCQELQRESLRIASG